MHNSRRRHETVHCSIYIMCNMHLIRVKVQDSGIVFGDGMRFNECHVMQGEAIRLLRSVYGAVIYCIDQPISSTWNTLSDVLHQDCRS